MAAQLGWALATLLAVMACSQPIQTDLYRLLTTKPTPTSDQGVAVQSIAFSSPNNTPPGLTFQAGTTVAQSITVAFTPSTATNKNVTWSSQNGKVVITPGTTPNTATVVPVTGAGAPQAGDLDTITARPADGGAALQKTCAVVFTGPSSIPVTGISLDQSAIVVASGSSSIVTVTILPSNSSVQTVNWSITTTTSATATFQAGETTTTTSTDHSPVTIVGGNPGTGVTVTATLVDGANTFTQTCAVTVTDTQVTGVSFISPPTNISVGNSATLTARVTPGGATNSAVTWSTDKPAFVTVTPGTHSGADSTATVTVNSASAAPSFTVTATSVQDNAIVATQTINASVAVSSVTIDQSTSALLEGETGGLTATVLPVNATSPTVTWSSSNGAVSVNATTGQMQAQGGQGGNSATITATADGVSATLVVSVVAPAQVPVLGAPASPGGGVYTGATMALNPSNGFPVIAYRDDLGNGHVQEWLGGGTWSTNMSSFNIGAFLVDPTGATNLALAVDSVGNPTVGYVAASNSAVSVTQWNGTFWNSLNGAGGFTSRYLSLAIGPYHSINGPTLSDVPFLAMGFDFNPPQAAALEVYDTTFPGWALTDVGALTYDGPNSTSTSSIINPTGSPSASSVLVASLINGTNLRVRGFPGGVLKAQTTVSNASFVSLGVDGQGLAYVAAVDGTGTAHLYQQSGGSLVQVATIGSGQSDSLSLVLDPRPGMEVAYVAFRNISTGTASLWKWDNGTFGLLIVDVSGVGAQVDGTKLVMNSNGHLYYLYESGGVVTVKDFVR